MRRYLVTLGVALAVGVAPLDAQMLWDAPPLVGHASPPGLSLFLLSPDPGDGLGVLASMRTQRGALDWGYRAALGEGAGGDLAAAAGVDVSGLLTRGVDEADVDVVWWSGAGASVGNELAISVPLGIAVGWSGRGDDVVLSPYAGVHVTLDVMTGPGDAMDLSGAVDLGLDMTVGSGWIVRVGASVGGRDALAIGVRIPRGSDRVQD